MEEESFPKETQSSTHGSIFHNPSHKQKLQCQEIVVFLGVALHFLGNIPMFPSISTWVFCRSKKFRKTATQRWNWRWDSVMWTRRENYEFRQVERCSWLSCLQVEVYLQAILYILYKYNMYIYILHVNLKFYSMMGDEDFISCFLVCLPRCDIFFCVAGCRNLQSSHEGIYRTNSQRSHTKLPTLTMQMVWITTVGCILRVLFRYKQVYQAIYRT